MPNIRHLTLKSKLYAVITVLGLLPGVATAVSFFLLKASDEAQVALDKASQGTIHLEHINGLVYAVVMELRGIYMSADAKQAEPFEAFLAAVTSGLEERRRAERRESPDDIGVTAGGKAHRLQMLDRSEVGVRITPNQAVRKAAT